MMARLLTLSCLAFVYFALVRGCCWPGTNSLNNYKVVYKSDAKGKKSFIEGQQSISTDGAKRIRNIYENITIDGKYIQRRRIENYFTMTQHTITDNMCKKIPMYKKWSKTCIPDGSTKYQSMYMGVPHASNLSIDVYMVEAWDLYLAVTADEKYCIPVGTWSLDKSPTRMIQIYTNFTTAIEDESVFSLPSNCQKEPLTEWQEMEWDDETPDASKPAFLL